MAGKKLVDIPEEPIHTAKKGTRYLHTKKIPILDDHGEPRYLLGISDDITDRKRADAKARKAADALARSNAELEQFAYVASHDLQEPLRMVSSFTELLVRRYEGQLDATAREYVGFILGGTRWMQQLINALLAYSRVDSHGKPFEMTDLGGVVDDAVRNLRSAVDEQHGEITHERLPMVSGDRTQLIQLFQNLVGNALKFRGEAVPRIHVSAQADSGRCTLAVRDNGIGIAPEHTKRIFKIFQRLHGRDAYPGTGVGLAIAKKIVERHGGRIWVESQPGSGSTFYFTLPEPRRTAGATL
ncbi:MAG: ATP-binding protein [Deltaproteobacteria bacterium]|nr:ATP-binding protein [Deltaproteobacteria bacterium]